MCSKNKIIIILQVKTILSVKKTKLNIWIRNMSNWILIPSNKTDKTIIQYNK
jgi:hypothetical protein